MVLYLQFAYGENPILGSWDIKQNPSLILFGTPCSPIRGTRYTYQSNKKTMDKKQLAAVVMSLWFFLLKIMH